MIGVPMARRSEFYKGRRKRRNYALIPGIILMLLFGAGVVLFYSTQKYAIIADDGVSIELPLLTGKTTANNETGREAAEFEQVNVEIRFEEADYSGVPATAGRRVQPVRAIFVPYDDVNPERVHEYANRLSSGNALMLEVKREDGYLAWYSSAPLAFSYGLNMNTVESTDTLVSILSELKADNIYTVAKISCCIDTLLGSRSPDCCLHNAAGSDYFDGTYFWLDPYNNTVRNYTAQLVRELWELGFDEVVLDNVMHPVIEPLEGPDGTVVEQLFYTREMSTTPSPLGAVSGFAVNVEEQLADREQGKFLSVYINSTTALSKPDEANGQDAGLFLRIYDRVYYDTDKYAYTFNVEDITPLVTVGNVKNRFVPVVINYLPDNTSWILVDQE